MFPSPKLIQSERFDMLPPIGSSAAAASLAQASQAATAAQSAPATANHASQPRDVVSISAAGQAASAGVDRDGDHDGH